MSDFVPYCPGKDFDLVFQQISEGVCPFIVDQEFNCSHCLFEFVCYHPNTLLYGKD